MSITRTSNKLILLITVVALTGATSTWAQISDSKISTNEDGVEIVEEEAVGSIMAPLDPMSRDDAALEKDTDDKSGYALPTLRNISKLYFKYGFLQHDDRDALTSFIALNECSTYRRYRTNDIEWTEILNSYSDAMPKISKKFPRRLVFTRIVNMDEYNGNTQIFNVHPHTIIDNTKVFLVNALSKNKICGLYTTRAFQNIPSDVVFRLNEPVKLTEIKMQPDMARKIIDLGNERYRKTPSHMKRPDNIFKHRKAYVFVYGDVFRINDKPYTPKGSAVLSYPQFHMTVERMEVYTDKDKKTLIHAVDYRKKRTMDKAEKELRKDYKKRREAIGKK